jgi:hypothetical protein
MRSGAKDQGWLFMKILPSLTEMTKAFSAIYPFISM